MKQSFNFIDIFDHIRLRLALALALALALFAGPALAQEPVLDCGQLDVFIRDGIELFPEEREWYKENCEEEEEDIVWPPLPTPTPRPPIDTCAQLPYEIVVSDYKVFSTQCRRVGVMGVGNAELIAQGVIDAVDVWSLVGRRVIGEVRVCFRAQGKLKFLDAAMAPRAVSDLAAEYIDGMTCGRINRVGTVVLVPGALPPQATTAETSESPPDPAGTSPSATSYCQLITADYLSLRAGPSVNYMRLLSMPRGSRLLGNARIGDWFMVNFKGQLGWASQAHLLTSPGCDALDETGAVILPPTIEPRAPDAEETMTDAADSMPEADAMATAEAAEQAPVTCQLTAVDILNMRAGPGAEYDIVAEIPYQSSFSAFALANDWFMVVFEGQTGWVSRQYVFRRGDCNALSAAPSAEMLPASERAAADAEAPADVTETEERPMSVPGARALSHCNLRTGDIINLRQGPGLEFAVLAEIPYRTVMAATARTVDWFLVEYQAETGWVNINYVFRNGACG